MCVTCCYTRYCVALHVVIVAVCVVTHVAVFVEMPHLEQAPTISQYWIVLMVLTRYFQYYVLYFSPLGYFIPDNKFYTCKYQF